MNNVIKFVVKGALACAAIAAMEVMKEKAQHRAFAAGYAEGRYDVSDNWKEHIDPKFKKFKEA